MIQSPLKYFIAYKPYGMLSQFTKEGNNTTLAELFSFPKDVYPVGRLDADSEGLLLITNDKKLNHYLLHPRDSVSTTALFLIISLSYLNFLYIQSYQKLWMKKLYNITIFCVLF